MDNLRSEGLSFNTISKDTSETLTPSGTVSGFRSVFKATSIFGGVQVFQILISLIRGKVLAVLIGTAGMGLNGLLLSGLNVVIMASGLGLSTSAIREISAANQSNNTQLIRRVYTIFNRWIWLTAIIGVFLTVTLSPFLSKFAFGDYSHTISFVLLSITFVFIALTEGIHTILRGMRKIRELAQANIAGAIAGLMIALPIFYFYRIEGVVPAIIASAAATYLVSIYFRRKVEVKPTKLSLKETFSGGKEMVSLGIILTASSVLSYAVKFILNAYISRTGSLDDLGIFNAGNSIMFGYVGMVFAAMAADYYPRLSGVINKPKEWKNVVNQQAEIVALFLGPILAFILLSAPFLIRILLSVDFLPAVDFIIWAAMAVVFQGISWVSGFILISMRDNKIFLYTEVAALIWSLSMNMLFFNLLGVKGLGISMFINNIFGSAMMYFVLKSRYKFILSKATYRLTAIYLFLLSTTVLYIILFDYPRAYYFAGITFIISAIISIHGLNSRMDLMQLLRNFRNRKT